MCVAEARSPRSQFCCVGVSASEDTDACLLCLMHAHCVLHKQGARQSSGLKEPMNPSQNHA